MPAQWPWETASTNGPVAPKPNRAQRRAMEQQAKRNQRRGQRAFDRAQKSADNAEKE